ncbi:MAG: hypothetical protein LBK74_06795 [Treponema sp.]|jgi:hypothetical protein|nr:hypothetical protein [Treponema sp.]
MAKPGTAAAAQPARAGPALLPGFLWSGSWESGGNLTGRFEIQLDIPGPALELRFQLLDRRPASSWAGFTGSFGGDSADKTVTQPGAGLYHIPTGSRILYGVLDSYGLAARVRNIWIRGAPYAEVHAPSSADLKTAPASTAVPQGYAYLGTPLLNTGAGRFRGFVSAAVSAGEERIPAGTAGADYHFGKAGLVRLEGFYTRRELPERTASAWFSTAPSLPGRDTRLFAGTLIFNIPGFGFAADFARSETFGFGRDYYGNLGLRFGDRPWRLSLAADGAGSRYVDSSGAVPGAGVRGAVRLERRGRRSSLFRLSGLVRGSGPEEPDTGPIWDFASMAGSVNRRSLELYCRLPASSAPLALSRFSLSLDRDGRDREKVLDSAGALAALKLGPVDSVSQGKITGRAGDGHDFVSGRVSQSLSWTWRRGTQKRTLAVRFSAKAGYEQTAGKDGFWNASFSAAVRGKQSRLGLTAAASKLPGTWEYTVSWRLQR